MLHDFNLKSIYLANIFLKWIKTLLQFLLNREVCNFFVCSIGDLEGNSNFKGVVAKRPKLKDVKRTYRIKGWLYFYIKANKLGLTFQKKIPQSFLSTSGHFYDLSKNFFVDLYYQNVHISIITLVEHSEAQSKQNRVLRKKKYKVRPF